MRHFCLFKNLERGVWAYVTLFTLFTFYTLLVIKGSSDLMEESFSLNVTSLPSLVAISIVVAEIIFYIYYLASRDPVFKGLCKENFVSNLSIERIGPIEMRPGWTWIEYILQTRSFSGAEQRTISLQLFGR